MLVRLRNLNFYSVASGLSAHLCLPILLIQILTHHTSPCSSYSFFPSPKNTLQSNTPTLSLFPFSFSSISYQSYLSI